MPDELLVKVVSYQKDDAEIGNYQQYLCWYLFNAWPLACGNAHENSKFIWRFFSNDVNADILQSRLTHYAARKGCDVEELNVFDDEQVLLSIPGTSFPIPLPYIITFREMQISCVLVKSPTKGGAK